MPPADRPGPRAAELQAEHGDAVRVETADGIAQPSHHLENPIYLDGGIEYSPCSTGFNVRNPSTGERFFLTAGHCHRPGAAFPKGSIVSSHGRSIGPVIGAFYGPWDDAIVQVTNSHWWQGPEVWTYGNGPTNNGEYVTISGSADPPVGTAVCSAGKTTGLTCGTITAKGVSTNTAGVTVTNLVRHTACTEPGDSGGPVFVSTLHTNGAWTHNALGVNSNSVVVEVDGRSRCREVQGNPNISHYYPLTRTLADFGAMFGVELWTG